MTVLGLVPNLHLSLIVRSLKQFRGLTGGCTWVSDGLLKCVSVRCVLLTVSL